MHILTSAVFPTDQRQAVVVLNQERAVLKSSVKKWKLLLEQYGLRTTYHNCPYWTQLLESRDA